jgi:hypothetical protein
VGLMLTPVVPYSSGYSNPYAQPLPWRASTHALRNRTASRPLPVVRIEESQNVQPVALRPGYHNLGAVALTLIFYAD